MSDVGSGFGSFMQGLAGGLKTGQTARRERQLDKLYDAGIRRLENDETAQALDLEAEGEDPGLLSDSALGDPVWERLMGFFEGRKKAKPAVSALPITGSPEQSLGVAQTMPMGEDPEEYAATPFADGGEVEEEDKPSRARAAGASTRAAIGEYVGGSEKIRQAEPARQQAINTRMQANPGAVREFLGGLMGGDAAPAAAGGPAGAGAAPSAPPAALSTPPYAPSRNAGPALHSVPAPTGKEKSNVAVKARGGGAGGALPVGPPKPEGPEQMDFSGVDPMEVPDYKTRDWEEFRKSAVKSAILRGTPRADAVDKVDQQVIGMQMRGFQNFATQGMALQQAGDLKAAAAAYRAAFQYMPTTSDVKFSIVKGNLVAYAVDEETGQPESRPWLVNPETLSGMAKNFSTPGAWAEHAQDRRNSDLVDKELGIRERRLDEHEIPHGRAMARASQTQAEASMLSARASNRRSLTAGDDDGPSPSDNLKGDEDVRALVGEAVMATDEDGEPIYTELQDQRQRDRLIAAITEVRRRRPDMSSDTILQAILQRAQSSE